VKLIAGLGNPGRTYRETRHNVGFVVADELARRHALTFESGPGEALVARARRLGAGALIVKPLTFMNLSGRAVAEVQRYFRIERSDVLVILDETNLPLGRVRARARGSAGGHNGLQSVVESLGTTEVARLRIGVGRGDLRRDLASHVLARFDPEEQPEIERAVQLAADAAELFVTEGIERVMNRFNADGRERPESVEPDPE